MRGSLFPLVPLRVKCQNHERDPISPILVANVYSSCQDMDHQKRGNRGLLLVLAHFTLRGNRGNRDPLMVKKADMCADMCSLEIGWFMLQM